MTGSSRLPKSGTSEQQQKIPASSGKREVLSGSKNYNRNPLSSLRPCRVYLQISENLDSIPSSHLKFQAFVCFVHKFRSYKLAKGTLKDIKLEVRSVPRDPGPRVKVGYKIMSTIIAVYSLHVQSRFVVDVNQSM